MRCVLYFCIASAHWNSPVQNPSSAKCGEDTVYYDKQHRSDSRCQNGDQKTWGHNYKENKVTILVLPLLLLFTV